MSASTVLVHNRHILCNYFVLAVFISLSFSVLVSDACVSLSNGNQNIARILFIYGFSPSFCVLSMGCSVKWSVCVFVGVDVSMQMPCH